MKTINVMMASLAALLVAACSQNEVTEVSPDAHPQMKFGVYTGTPRTITVSRMTLPMAISTVASALWGILRAARAGMTQKHRPPPDLCTTRW